MTVRFPIAMALVAACVATTAPLQAATTVAATLTGYNAGLITGITRHIVNGPVANEALGVTTSRMVLDRTGGSSGFAFLGGATGAGFVAFCVEPQQYISVGAPVTYTLRPLSEAANSLGGIGADKADKLKELFGRNAASGGFATMTPARAAALQISIWEIVAETNSSLSATAGNIRFTAAAGTVEFATASRQSIRDAGFMLAAINGAVNAPRASNLMLLQSSTGQDLLVFGRVPEPESWAMLIAGFGLVGATLRRRRAGQPARA
jgi:hypothetical protein